MLCVQLCKDAWESHILRLSKVCDIAELLRRRPDMDWVHLDTEATRLGCRRIMTVGLATAHELLGAPLPQSIHARIADRRIRPLIEHVRHRLLGNDYRESVRALSRRQFHFSVRERWREKLYSLYRGSGLYGIQEMLVPSAKDREMISLAGVACGPIPLRTPRFVWPGTSRDRCSGNRRFSCIPRREVFGAAPRATAD